MTQLKTIFGLDTVIPFVYPAREVQYNSINPSQIMGVELEIEHAATFAVVDGMHTTDDGSLREDGVEFITAPMNYQSMMSCLSDFFKGNHPTDDCYSERTSIHVHMNVQDFSLEQLANLTLLYQTCEYLLYDFIGHDRDKNIFCVPLNECMVSRNAATSFINGDYSPVHRWLKYTGMNLAPIRTIGTVEFRHMHGNADLAFISQWLRILIQLLHTAQKMEYAQLFEIIVKLNSSSAYEQLLHMIFGDETKAIITPDYKTKLSYGVLAAKYLVIRPASPKAPNPLRGVIPNNIVPLRGVIPNNIVPDGDVRLRPFGAANVNWGNQLWVEVDDLQQR